MAHGMAERELYDLQYGPKGQRELYDLRYGPKGAVWLMVWLKGSCNLNPFDTSKMSAFVSGE